MDIRDTVEYKEFKSFYLNTLHMRKMNVDSANRCVFIVDTWLDRKQNIKKVTLENICTMLKQEGSYVTKERVRDIFTKYIAEFILYLYYIKQYDMNNEILVYTINLLSESSQKEIINYITNGEYKIRGGKRSSNSIISPKYINILNCKRSII